MKKKLTKRSKEQYPALKPELNLKSRFELIQVDYIHKLNDKEKAWLNKFNEEYVNDNVDRKNLKNNLHNTPALKKDCDDRNNARNRDILSRGKASGTMNYLEDLKREDRLTMSPEELLTEESESTEDLRKPYNNTD